MNIFKSGLSWKRGCHAKYSHERQKYSLTTIPKNNFKSRVSTLEQKLQPISHFNSPKFRRKRVFFFFFGFWINPANDGFFCWLPVRQLTIQCLWSQTWNCELSSSHITQYWNSLTEKNTMTKREDTINSFPSFLMLRGCRRSYKYCTSKHDKPSKTSTPPNPMADAQHD